MKDCHFPVPPAAWQHPEALSLPAGTCSEAVHQRIPTAPCPLQRGSALKDPNNPLSLADVGCNKGCPLPTA